MLRERRLDLLLYLGDVYDNGTAEEYRQNYEPLFGPLAERTAPTPGNHEWPSREQGYRPYWEAVRGRTPPDFYAFRASGWQLLSLNSEADHGAGAHQLRWLERKLDHTPKLGNCRIAFWHRPRFSAGSHGDADDVAPLWDTLTGEARLVLWGHDHNMQRLRARDGIVAMVSGAGGHSHYELDPDYRGLEFGDSTHYGALRLRLRRGEASWRFVAVGGEVLDRGEVGCRRVQSAAD